jgi:hypothetical protein
MSKIRAYPIKSEKLCARCMYGWGNGCKFSVDCNQCDMHIEPTKNLMECYCCSIRFGDPCKRFKRA